MYTPGGPDPRGMNFESQVCGKSVVTSIRAPSLTAADFADTERLAVAELPVPGGIGDHSDHHRAAVETAASTALRPSDLNLVDCADCLAAIAQVLSQVSGSSSRCSNDAGVGQQQSGCHRPAGDAAGRAHCRSGSATSI